MGPLLAVPLQNIQDFKIAGFSINSITGGGYLMAGAWLVFTTFLQTVFVDPPRDDDEDVSDDDSEDQAALESSPDVEDSLSRPLLGPATEDAQKPFDMRPAYCCILSLFVLKFVQQGMISSLPEFTHQFYGWRSAFIGGFLSVLSLSMLPVNFGVALGATVISDRQLLLSSEVVSLLGCLLMLSYGGSFPAVWAYVTGTVLVYAATIVMESCSMSLLRYVPFANSISPSVTLSLSYSSDRPLSAKKSPSPCLVELAMLGCWRRRPGAAAGFSAICPSRSLAP